LRGFTYFKSSAYTDFTGGTMKEKEKKNAVRFHLTKEETEEVDAVLEQLGGKRGTAAKIAFLQWIRNKKN
jgi:2-iminoacetate synthase ThiH